MAIILGLGQCVQAATGTLSFRLDARPDPIQYDSSVFCLNSARGWFVNGSGSLTNVQNRFVQYQTSSFSGESLSQRVAFAVYTLNKMGLDCDNYATELQELIWVDHGGNSNAGNWTSDNFLYARASQYQLFYDGVLKGGDEIQMSTVPANEAGAQILVDFTNQKYTAGPYKIKFDGVTGEAAQVLYNELSGVYAQKFTDCPPFAAYEITGLDGKNIEFLDESGTPIAFPDFVNDKAFYIRFTPNSGVTTINPGIQINYISAVNGKMQKYTNTTESTFTATVHISKSEFQASGLSIEQYILRNFHIRIRGTGTISLYAVFDVQLVPDGNSSDDYETYTFTGSVPNDNLQELGKIESTEEQTQPNPNGNNEGPGSGQIEWGMDLNFSWDINARLHVSSYREWLYYWMHYRYWSLDASITHHWVESVSGTDYSVTAEWNSSSVSFGPKDISMRLGGNVWQDFPDDKTGAYSGTRDPNLDKSFAGMEVRLYRKPWSANYNTGTNGEWIATTSTDSNGNYSFSNLDPLCKYYVAFRFNGQLYEATYYMNNLTGGFSNAREIGRSDFNLRFETIESTPYNYRSPTYQRRLV